jgi:pimeloyl-ACP methyl ester carboxylesterase
MVSGPAGTRPLLLSYPWSPANTAYIAAAGGPSEHASERSARRLVAGLARTRQVVMFEYPPGVRAGEQPPEQLPISEVLADVLEVADVASAATFDLLGYSWSASVAIEVAARTDRCVDVLVGGWPPVAAPVAALAALCRERGAEDRPPNTKTAPLMRMYASYYDSLLAAPAATTGPGNGARAVFYGDLDRQPMAPGAGSVADLIQATRDQLRQGGWTVHPLPGRDHLSAMDAAAVIAAARAIDREGAR